MALNRVAIVVVAVVLGGPAILWAGLSLRYGRDAAWSMLLGELDRAPVDFATLDRGGRPNQVLICPSGYCAREPNVVAPIYRESVPVVRAAWLNALGRDKRMYRLSGRDEDIQFAFEIHTPILRFPDLLTLRLIPLGEGQTSFAIYSRAAYGYYDFGVNARRVRRWLADVERFLETQPPS